MSERPVAVLGAGSIGVAFAVLFGASGARVRIWDPVPEAREPPPPSCARGSSCCTAAA